jgi:hypothetical protein
VEVGITRAMLVILSRSVSGEGGVDGQVDEQGEQGVDDGTGRSVCGCISGGVARVRLCADDGADLVLRDHGAVQLVRPRTDLHNQHLSARVSSKESEAM